jgi:hypothetical protein
MSTRIPNEEKLSRRRDRKKPKSIGDENVKKLSTLEKLKELPPSIEKKKEKHKSASHSNKKEKSPSKHKSQKAVDKKTPRTPKPEHLSVSMEQTETRARSMSDTSAFQSIIISSNQNKKIPKFRVTGLQTSEFHTLVEEENSFGSDTEEKSGSSSTEKSMPTTEHKRKSLLFEDGQPIIKAGSMESIVSWLLGCSGIMTIRYRQHSTTLLSLFQTSVLTPSLLFTLFFERLFYFILIIFLTFDFSQFVSKYSTNLTIGNSTFFCSDRIIILSFLLGGYTTFWTPKQLLTFLQLKYPFFSFLSLTVRSAIVHTHTVPSFIVKIS